MADDIAAVLAEIRNVIAETDRQGVVGFGCELYACCHKAESAINTLLARLAEKDAALAQVERMREALSRQAVSPDRFRGWVCSMCGGHAPYLADLKYKPECCLAALAKGPLP